MLKEVGEKKMTQENKTEQKTEEIRNCIDCFSNFEHLPLRSPLIDAEETDEAILLKVELPGIKKEHIKLSADKDSIEIKADRKDIKESANEKTIYYSEREYSGFERQLMLPCEIDPNSIDAKYLDGILSIRIAKVKSEKKEIHID